MYHITILDLVATKSNNLWTLRNSHLSNQRNVEVGVNSAFSRNLIISNIISIINVSFFLRSITRTPEIRVNVIHQASRERRKSQKTPLRGADDCPVRTLIYTRVYRD